MGKVLCGGFIQTDESLLGRQKIERRNSCFVILITEQSTLPTRYLDQVPESSKYIFCQENNGFCSLVQAFSVRLGKVMWMGTLHRSLMPKIKSSNRSQSVRVLLCKDLKCKMKSWGGKCSLGHYFISFSRVFVHKRILYVMKHQKWWKHSHGRSAPKTFVSDYLILHSTFFIVKET